MVLHLLGKKSWNVYNADSIARVQADEAAAAAAEHAQEQRMQDADAARRLAILRGQTPPPLPEPEPEIDPSNRSKFGRRETPSATGFAARKRKRQGEDDTDFEMRLFKERTELGDKVAVELGGRAAPAADKRSKVSIIGRDGHIDLVGVPPSTPKAKNDSKTEGKNHEYEEEAARKKRELEDQYTVRFSHAAGRDGFAAGDPWYASASRRRAVPVGAAQRGEIGMEAPTKDVWGRDDAKRQDREVKRIISNDPLAVMARGAQRVREMEKEKKKADQERLLELETLRKDERRREKRRKMGKLDSHGARAGEGVRSSHRHRSDRPEHSERHGGRGQHRDNHRSIDRHSKRDTEKDHDRGPRRLVTHPSPRERRGEGSH